MSHPRVVAPTPSASIDVVRSIISKLPLSRERRPPSVNTLPTPSPTPIITYSGVSSTGSIPAPNIGTDVGSTQISGVNAVSAFNYLRNGRDRSAAQTPLSFWAPLSPVAPYSPRTVYDILSKRWITVALDNAQTNLSRILIAVSKSIEFKDFKFYQILVDPNGNYWGDYLQMGYNNNLLVFTVNAYGISSSTFQAIMFVFDKPQLLNDVVVSQTVELGTNQGGDICPAEQIDQNLPYFPLAQVLSPNIDGNGFIRTMALFGSVGTLNLLTGQMVVSGPAWQPYPPIIDKGFARQVGTDIRIHPGDHRLQNFIFRNGQFWASHTVMLPATGIITRSSAQWWNWNPEAILLQRGLLDDPSGNIFYAYPTLDVNNRNDMILGYSYFTTTTYPSGAYAMRLSTDPASDLRGQQILAQGVGPYTQDFGSGIVRWGDYMAVTTDPTDELSFWLHLENAGPANTWTTILGRVLLPTNNFDGRIPDTFFQDSTSNFGTFKNVAGNLIHQILKPDSTVGTYQWGITNDTVLTGRVYAANYSSIIVWRGSVLKFFLYPLFNNTSATGLELHIPTASSTDVPLLGDIDGDGQEELCLFRAGQWNFTDYLGKKKITYNHGISGDIPLLGDFFGVGRCALCVWRPSNQKWLILDPLTLQTLTLNQWGLPGDVPLVGDYLGNKRFQCVVWRPSNGKWYIYDPISLQSKIVQWGQNGDIPLEGDFDGDRIWDHATFRPSARVFFVIRSTNGIAYNTTFGGAGDSPLNGANVMVRMKLLGLI